MRWLPLLLVIFGCDDGSDAEPEPQPDVLILAPDAAPLPDMDCDETCRSLDFHCGVSRDDCPCDDDSTQLQRRCIADAECNRVQACAELAPQKVQTCETLCDWLVPCYGARGELAQQTCVQACALSVADPVTACHLQANRDCTAALACIDATVERRDQCQSICDWLPRCVQVRAPCAVACLSEIEPSRVSCYVAADNDCRAARACDSGE